jgi:two-component system chemotaxis response regulator CheY
MKSSADTESRSGSKRGAAKLAKVLVADDSAYVRARTVTLLKQLGYEAVEANDGVQAVEMFKQTRPDAILMDITMPVMDGLEALREILALDPNAKVAMVTAAGQQRVVREAIEIGACDFVVKPFQPERFKATLEMLVS